MCGHKYSNINYYAYTMEFGSDAAIDTVGKFFIIVLAQVILSRNALNLRKRHTLRHRFFVLCPSNISPLAWAQMRHTRKQVHENA